MSVGQRPASVSDVRSPLWGRSVGDVRDLHLATTVMPATDGGLPKIYMLNSRCMGKPRKKWVQMELRPRTWGGKREGAGRPKKGGAGVAHVRRQAIGRRDVAHVTVRLLPVVKSLRNGRCFRVVRGCFAAGCERFGFRLVQFSVQGQHLHLVCEADDRVALARGMQGLSIRLARRLNRQLGRSGKVLRDRYHSRVLKTPTEVRNVLAYVLCNFRRHSAERGVQIERGWIDPYSSGPHFGGWRDLVRPPEAYARGPCCTASPRSWLLDKGWLRLGRISVATVPAGT